ncbi:MAG: hypothetical protein R3C12_00825 [Planctomycetaceae bacterium]
MLILVNTNESRLMTYSPARMGLLACFALILGCGGSGPETGTLDGQVLLKGAPYSKPAELAIISMETGQAATAPLDAEGRFQFAGKIVVGNYTAYLTPAKPKENAEQPMSVTIDTSVPDQYWNEATSPLKITIKQGNNSETLNLE